MKPEEVDRKLIRLDDCPISPKAYNTLFAAKGKKRDFERRDDKTVNIKLTKEASKTVAARLRKKLIEHGKKPNSGPHFLCTIEMCTQKF